MSKAGSKILGTLFFILLISFIFYLILLPKKIVKRNITKIEIKGNRFLSETDYLKQTKLLNVSEYNRLTLSIIKDRLDKHPYILKADIEQNDKILTAYITEKKMTAVLLKGTVPYFISERNEILPLMPNTKFIDLPVISNTKYGEDFKSFELVKGDDLIDALKIIEAVKLVDSRMLNRLSEINLRNGKDIILSFSGYPVPIIFGRGDEGRKMVYLESLWKNQMLIDDIKNTKYIDLRFAGNIYIGSEITGQNIGPIQ